MNRNLKDYLEQKKEYLHCYLNQSIDKKIYNILNIGEKNIRGSSRGRGLKEGEKEEKEGRGRGKHNRRININQNFIKNEENKNKDNEQNNPLTILNLNTNRISIKNPFSLLPMKSNEKFSEIRNKEKIDHIISNFGSRNRGKAYILKRVMKDGFLNEKK